MFLNPYYRAAASFLRRTGDRMLEGRTITLGRDPIDPFEAVTKRYLDNLAAEPRAPYYVGRYYTTPAFGNATTTVAWVTGSGRLSPFYVHTDIVLDRISMFSQVNANRGIRLGIYELDSLTLSPTELVLNAGALTGVLALGFHEITINQELPRGWYGLAHAMFGAGTNASFAIQGGTSTVGYGWYGSSALTSVTPDPATAYAVTGTATSWETDMPAPGDWILSSLEAISGVWVRRSS